jgi:3-oxoacyl-[acyl-carrier protein] reductase
MSRSIVITGASKGIGRAAAEGLAATGWEVIGIARHTPPKFPGQFVATDLGDPQGTAELSRLAERRYVLGIVNNIAAVQHGQQRTMAKSAWRFQQGFHFFLTQNHR